MFIIVSFCYFLEHFVKYFFLFEGFFMKKKSEKDVIKKIKIAMLEKGFTQTSLAKKLGKTHAAISKWLNGKANITMKNLEDIATLTDKPLNYFFDNSADVQITNSQLGNHNTMNSSYEIDLLKQKLKVVEKEQEVQRTILENIQLKLKHLQTKKK